MTKGETLQIKNAGDHKWLQ